MNYSLIRATLKTVILLLVFCAGVQGADVQGAGVQGMESRKFGIGLIVGAPAGISLKYWLNDVNALTGGVSLGNDPIVQLNFLWHDFNVIRPDKGRLPLHYGFGAQTQFERYSNRVGLRGVLGLTYIFDNSPFDIFFEIAPLLELGDNSRFWLTAALGARYFF